MARFPFGFASLQTFQGVVFLLSSATTDAQEDDHYMRLLRSFEVADKQRLYQWRDRSDDDDEYKALMGWIAAGDDSGKLPKDLRLVEDKKAETEWIRHQKDASSRKLFLHLEMCCCTSFIGSKPSDALNTVFTGDNQLH